LNCGSSLTVDCSDCNQWRSPCLLSVTFGRQPNSFGRKPKLHCCFVTVTETALKLHYRSVSTPKMKPNFGQSQILIHVI